MRFVGLGLKFRMKLHRHEPRVVFDFNNLHQIATRINSADHQAGLLHRRDVVVVHFEAVAMTFANVSLPISAASMRAGLERTLVTAQAHGSALIDNLLLLLHHRNDGLR